MIITVVGAGGKTTVCNTLGRNLAQKGHPVLFTTTTRIYRPEGCPVYAGQPEDISPLGRFTAAGRQKIKNGKLMGFSGEETDCIERGKLFDYIFVEGDGAKGRPVKAPAEWEPVYPALTRLILGVIGLDSVGKPVSEDNVHRSGLFMSITDSRPGDIITCGHLYKLIHHPMGLFRSAPRGVKKVVLLNKTDLSGNNKEEIYDLQRKSKFPVLAVSRDIDWVDGFIGKFIGETKG